MSCRAGSSLAHERALFSRDWLPGRLRVPRASLHRPALCCPRLPRPRHPLHAACCPPVCPPPARSTGHGGLLWRELSWAWALGPEELVALSSVGCAVAPVAEGRGRPVPQPASLAAWCMELGGWGEVRPCALRRSAPRGRSGLCCYTRSSHREGKCWGPCTPSEGLGKSGVPMGQGRYPLGGPESRRPALHLPGATVARSLVPLPQP